MLGLTTLRNALNNALCFVEVTVVREHITSTLKKDGERDVFSNWVRRSSNGGSGPELNAAINRDDFLTKHKENCKQTENN